jgi:hypothetical protein
MDDSNSSRSYHRSNNNSISSNISKNSRINVAVKPRDLGSGFELKKISSPFDSGRNYK